ncbi:hypothetical protein Hanom_Chr06g00477791 [Helianthus anomalus]
MGLHILLGFSKLNGAPFVATLAWPFFLKVLLSLKPFRNVIMSMVQDSRLFVFQLNQIIGSEGGLRFAIGRRRWGRVVRLVHERLPNVSRSTPFSNYDQSLQALSIVAF